jgi:hypothetical protein
MDRHRVRIQRGRRKGWCTSWKTAVDLPKLWQRRRGVHGRSRFAIAFILCAVGVIHLDAGVGADCVVEVAGFMIAYLVLTRERERDVQRVVVIVEGLCLC